MRQEIPYISTIFHDTKIDNVTSKKGAFIEILEIVKPVVQIAEPWIQDCLKGESAVHVRKGVLKNDHSRISSSSWENCDRFHASVRGPFPHGEGLWLLSRYDCRIW